MYSKPVLLKLVEIAVFMAVMYLALQLGISFGVEKKGWFHQSWELVLGGSIGAAAGLAFFLVFGAIGWVCGALYGAIGLVWLMLGGALGGLGLGTVFNILRSPHKYNFNWYIIIVVLVLGFLLARYLSSVAVRVADQGISATKPGRKTGA